MFNTERTVTNELIYRFVPGERALIRRQRHYTSTRTPVYVDLTECEVVKNNKHSVSVRVDGYEDEIIYVDTKDLVPTVDARRKELEACNRRLAELETE